MRCPVLVMVTDLERLEGFAELVGRLPAGQTGKRMGQRFPLIADLTDGELPAKIESSVDWIVDSLFGSMAYSMFQVESNRGVDEVAEMSPRATSSCSGSWSGSASGGIGWPGWSGTASRTCPANADVRRLLLRRHGRRPGRPNRPSPPGVLMRLIQDQDSVSWTEEAMREDARLQRRARTVRLALGLVIAGAPRGHPGTGRCEAPQR